MITYITAFIFYTLAMIGILFAGFVIYKKTCTSSGRQNKGLIKVLDSYMIAPKKTLLIVKIKNEKFLIASDVSSTTFLAKLEDFEENDKTYEKINQNENIQNIVKKMSSLQNVNSFKSQLETEEDKQEDYERKELELVQKQFMDLYNNVGSSEVSAAKKISAKKEVIKKLLRELEDGKSQIRSK